jgi:ABC-2 type transport system ATP-binding protein
VRELLNRLGDTAAEVDGISVHTPDLDDVFFALTGHPTTETTPETAGRQPAGSEGRAGRQPAGSEGRMENAR